jgi:hypothetical protein
LFWISVKFGLTVREGHRLQKFGSRMLRRILKHEEKKVAGEWRRLPNKKLHNLCSS